MKNILPLMLLTTALTGADTLAATTLDAWGTLATISTYACVDEACDTDGAVFVRNPAE